MQKWKALGGERKQKKNLLWRILISLILSAILEATWNGPTLCKFCTPRALPQEIRLLILFYQKKNLTGVSYPEHMALQLALLRASPEP